MIEVGLGKLHAIVLTSLEDQKACIESEEDEYHPVDLVSEQQTDNKPVVGRHSGEGLVKVEALLVVEPLGEVGQELLVDLMYQMHSQSSWFRAQAWKLSPQWISNCTKFLSGQVEAWLSLSECQQGLACL